LDCSLNKLPFSQLPVGLSLSIFKYIPQFNVFAERVINIGTEIDFSTEEVIDGENTTFAWYKGTSSIDGAYTSKYIPTEVGVYYCRMANKKFPGFQIKTSKVTVKILDANSDGYHDDDVAVLNKILTDNADNTLGWIGTDYGNWSGVTWDNSSPKRVEKLNCAKAKLTSLNVLSLENLTELDCSENNLITFEFSRTFKLTILNVSNCTNLIFLNCSGNKLTTLNISGCTALERLDCDNNQLTSLEFSSCKGIVSLHCYNNQLTSLNVSGCTALERLDCYNNQLTSLDVSSCKDLAMLFCSQNKLTSLDISGCTNLSGMSCEDNELPFSQLSAGLNISRIDYIPQNKVFSEVEISVGTEIDFSTEEVIDGENTTFVWYKDWRVINGVSSSKYTPTSRGIYFCIMTNTKFAGLTIVTNNVIVNNEAPTNFALSNYVVAEDSAIGTEVGVFSATDVDANDVLTYTIADNDNFKVEGDKLVTKSTFDFETKSEYKVVATVTDSKGAKVEKEFIITITDLNETPTDLTLSINVIAEDSAIGTEVGVLSATDVDANDVLTYTIVANDNFKVEGDKLVTKSTFDYDTKSEYKVTVTATDKGDLKVEKEFTITITEAKATAINKTVNGNVKLYPNPAVSTVTIKTTVIINRVDIVNVSGTVVYSNIVNTTNTTVDVSNLQSGIYTLRGYTSDGVITKQFVKK